MEQSHITFRQTVENLLTALAPIREREEPDEIGVGTARYLSESGRAAASAAVRAAEKVLGGLRVDEPASREWNRLTNLSIVAKQLLSDPPAGMPSWTILSLCELLEEGLSDLDRPAAAAEELEVPAVKERKLSERETIGHGDDRYGLIRDYGEGILDVVRAASAIGRYDAGIFDLLRRRALAASRVMWKIESDPPGTSYPPGWKDIYEVLWDLPMLVMSLEYTDEDADTRVWAGGTERWYVCMIHARHTARRMIAWAEKHAPEEEADA